MTVRGHELFAPVVNEREVRAAAGLTMAIGAVAFGYAYFTRQYVPLQVVATVFFVEFLIRVTAGIRFSPAGTLARVLTWNQPPDWVSAKPKRFAWIRAGDDVRDDDDHERRDPRVAATFDLPDLSDADVA